MSTPQERIRRLSSQVDQSTRTLGDETRRLGARLFTGVGFNPIAYYRRLFLASVLQRRTAV